MSNQEEKFELPNEVVTVKFIPRKKGMAANVADNHVISGGMLPNAVKTFRCPIKRSGGLANILNKAEKETIEELTGKNLSIYSNEKFWGNFKVKLYKDDASNKLDLSNPMDFVKLRLLESCEDDVALSWAERHSKPTYQFVITRAEEITDAKKSRLDVKKDAFKAYGRIEDNRETLIGVLKLLTNKPISSQSKLKWIQGQVEEYVDTEPKKFLSVIDDPNFETKVLLNKAVELKIVERNGNKYSTVDGLDLCESGNVPTFENAVRYLNDDKNQEVRDLIQAKIDSV